MLVPPTKAKGPTKPDAVQIAQKAVQEYETMTAELTKINEDFVGNYPEAHQQIQNIEEFKDKIREHIGKTKTLIAKAEMTIGPFIFTRRKTAPGYSAELMMPILLSMSDEDLGRCFRVLASAGVIDKVSVDNDSAKVYFPHNQDMAAAFESSFDRGGKALTPAVTVPKVP